MKRLILVLMLVSIVGLSLLDAQLWNLEVTSVSQREITANLSVTNNSNFPINWTFGDPLWITLMLDGHPYVYMVIQILTYVSIPAGSTRIEHLTYTDLNSEPPQLISFGTHVLQACLKNSGPDEITWLPVGNPEFIEVVSPNYHIDYELATTNVSWHEITATLNITNNTNTIINWDHDQDFWVGLFMDDTDYFTAIDPQPESIQIPLGASFSLPLSYNPECVQAVTGEHVLQAKRYNYEQQHWEPIGNPLTVTLTGPMSTDDAHTPYTKLSTYPNPFTDNISLAYQSKASSKAELKIYNIKGQLVNSISQITKSGENTFTWDGKGLRGENTPAGMYFIRIKNGAEVQIIKCMKMNN